MPGLAILARELRSQGRRYALVALSMLLGVLGVVAIALADSVASDMLVAREEQLRGRAATFEATIDSGAGADAATLRDVLAAASTEVARGLLLETSTPAALARPAAFRDALPGAAVTALWVTDDPDGVRRLPVVVGRFPDAGCYPGGVALNSAASASTGMTVGDEVVLTVESIHAPRVVVVTGIVADGRPEPTLVGRWDLLACAFPDRDTLDGASILVTAAAADAGTIRQLVLDASARTGVALTGGVRRVDTVDAIRAQIATLATLFGGCAILLLVVSALGIANVGIASVRERARELVVRRAFGARRSAVFAQVVSGAVLVGLLVGVAAFGLAIVGTYAVLPRLIPAESSIVAPAFPWVAGATGIGAALATGVVGGILPAIAATRLPIARALRG